MESDFFLGLKGPRLIKSVIKHTDRNKGESHSLSRTKASLLITVLINLVLITFKIKLEHKFKEKHSFIFSESKRELTGNSFKHLRK